MYESRILRLIVPGKTGPEIREILQRLSYNSQAIAPATSTEHVTFHDIEGECGHNFQDLYSPLDVSFGQQDLADLFPGYHIKPAKISGGSIIVLRLLKGNGDVTADSSVRNQASTLFK